jgi:outer membrane protein assembly factor BamB
VITYSANTVMGLNATTGAPVWQASPPLPAVGVDTLITEVFARSDETYYVWDGAKLMAFLAGSRGRHLWSAAVNTGDLILGISAQFGSDDTMYVGSGDGFRYAVDTRTGGCRWQYPGGRRSEIDMIDAPVAGGGGYCFIAPDYLNSGKIVALADV